MSVPMLHVRVHGVSMSMVHVLVHGACPRLCPWCRDMDRGHEHTPWTRTCATNMDTDTDMYLGNGHKVHKQVYIDIVITHNYELSRNFEIL
jgi:hypothetical protein